MLEKELKVYAKKLEQKRLLTDAQFADTAIASRLFV
jgi:hypothetical protein